MTEPIITLSNSSTMVDVSGLDDSVSGFSMKYLLYADDSTYSNWIDWVNDSVNSPTQKNLDNASNFSNYVLKWKCVLAA